MSRLRDRLSLRRTECLSYLRSAHSTLGGVEVSSASCRTLISRRRRDSRYGLVYGGEISSSWVIARWFHGAPVPSLSHCSALFSSRVPMEFFFSCLYSNVNGEKLAYSCDAFDIGVLEITITRESFISMKKLKIPYSLDSSRFSSKL